MKLVNREQMRRLEQAADGMGHSYDAMVERAGMATATAVKRRLGRQGASVLVLTGPGNNGGDGLVAARYLHEWGHLPTVYIWKRNRPDDPNLDKVHAAGIPVVCAADDAGYQQLAALVDSCDVVVDALLGTGATGDLRGDLPELLVCVSEGLASRRQARSADELSSLVAAPDAASAGEPLVVAVDLPSGMDCDTGEIDPRALAADVTVTFAFPKLGHLAFPGANHVGELLVANIGIDPTLAADIHTEVATGDLVSRLLPARPPNAHKGTFGKALIVAGSVNYTGAPCLATEAAYRAGAGLVTLAAAQRIYPIVAGKLTEATFIVLPDDMGALVPGAYRVLADALTQYDSLLVGPGIGREPSTGEFLESLLTSAHPAPRRQIGFGAQSAHAAKQAPQLPPTVIDADGLNLLSQREQWWVGVREGTVLTPHPAEMARLLGCSTAQVMADRLGTARQAAATWRCVVVLKGAYTIVAEPEGRVVVIPFAEPALATAGTGDVLAGTIVALMAQGLRGFDAAVAGAYLHGRAGQLAALTRGRAGLMASDLLPALAQALLEFGR